MGLLLIRTVNQAITRGEMNVDPAGGIFYILPYPWGWTAVAYRFDTHYPTRHRKLWREAVAHDLALCWSKKLELPRESIEEQVRPLHASCPHGSVRIDRDKRWVFSANERTMQVCSKHSNNLRLLFGLNEVVWRVSRSYLRDARQTEALRTVLRSDFLWAGL